MSADRWKTIEETFHLALDLSGPERLSYLDRACAGDDALRREVDSLLNQNQPEGFMEPLAGEALFSSIAAAVEEPSWEGRNLNHYHIGPLIGSGGVGRVYRARDTELVRACGI